MATSNSAAVATASTQFNIPIGFIDAQILAESGGDPNAVSSVGAVGLMQLMPGTAQEMGVTNRRNPVQNILGGTGYLAKKLDEFNGDPAKAIAAYHAGAGNVRKAITAGGTDWLQHLGPKTQAYVSKLLPEWQAAVAQEAKDVIPAPVAASQAVVNPTDIPAPIITSAAASTAIPEPVKANIARRFPAAERARGFRGGTFSRGIERGTKQSIGLAGQLLRTIGDATGFAGAIELGDELIQEAFVEAIANPASIEGLEDITSFGKAGTFVLQTLGEQISNLLLALIGGGIGGYLVKLGIGKAALQGIATKAGLSPVLKGAAAGTFTAFLPINTGEIIQEQRDRFDNRFEFNGRGSGPLAITPPQLGPSLALGALSSALEVLGFGLVGRAIFGAVKKETIDTVLRTVLRRVGHASLKSLAAEGGVEAVQEVLVIASSKINDPTFSITDAISSSEGLSRIAFAGVSGATVGGILGGGGGIATGIRDATRVGLQRADLREAVNPGKAAIDEVHGAKEKGTEDEVTSLFDLNIAAKQVKQRVDKVFTAVAVAVAAVKNKLAAKDQQAAVVAAQEQQRRTVGELDFEDEALDKAAVRLRELRANTFRAFNKVRAVISEFIAPSEGQQRNARQNTSVEKFAKRIKELKEKLKKASVDKRAELSKNILELVEEMTSTGLSDPFSVKVSAINSLANLGQKYSQAGFKKTARALKEAKRLLAFTRNRVANALNKLPTVEVTAETVAAAEGTTTPTAEILRSIAAVVKGTKKVAFAVGATLQTLPLAIKTAIGKANLAVTQDGDRVVITQRKDKGKDPVAESFATPVEELQDDSVVVTTRDEAGGVIQNEGVPRDAEAVQEAATRSEEIGASTEVRGPAEAVTESVQELNEEVEAKTTVVRFYDNEGNFLEERNVERLDDFIENEEVIDAVIAELRTKHGIEGFAVANNKRTHKTLLKGDSAISQLYKAIWNERKRIRAGRPLLPTLIIGEIRRRFTKGAKKVITLRTFMDRRQDALYIINQMANLVNKNSDPDVWAQRAIKFPELEEQTALFERQVNNMVSGELGLEGYQVFANLVEQPQQFWGVTADKNGNPSSILVEVHNTPDGWRAVNTKKPMFIFTAKNLRKLRQKLNQTKQFNRYGTQTDPNNSDEKSWKVEVAEIEPGIFIIKQTMPGMDSNLVFNQVREVADRGNRIGEINEYTIAATSPNGSKLKLHLGEITKLGRLQRLGPSNLLLGSALTRAHENFMYGLTTLINMGYVIDGVALEKAKHGVGRAFHELEKQRTSLAMSSALMNKVIYGSNITFKKSLASQKSLYALELLLENASETSLSLSDVQQLFTEKGNISLKDAIDFLLNDLLSQVSGIEASTNPRKIKKVMFAISSTVRKGVISATRTTKQVYEVGDYLIEQTPASIIVRNKTGKVIMQLPTTILDEETLGRQLSAAEKLSIRQRAFVLSRRSSGDVTEAADRISIAVGRAEALSTVDEEQISMLISLSGLYDRSISKALTATTTTTEGSNGETNFIDPTTSNEAVYDDDGNRIDTHSVVLEDDTAGQDDTSELDFHVRTRSKFDEDASKEVPFTMEIRQSKTQTGAAKNVFMKAGIQVSNKIRDWKIGKLLSGVLQRLNIKERIIIFDDAAIPSLLIQWEKIKNNKKYTQAQRDLAATYVDFIEGIKSRPTSGRILAPAGNLSDRVVLIYIAKRDTKNNASRGWRLAHELGHLVQYVYLDSLPTKIKAEILDALRPAATLKEQQEVFANWMAVAIGEDAPGLVGKDTTTNKVFVEMVRQLRIVYDWAKAQWGRRFAGPAHVKGLPAGPIVAKILRFQDFLSALNTHTSNQITTIPTKMTPISKLILQALREANAGAYIRNNTVDLVANFDTEGTAAERAVDSVFQNYVNDFRVWAATLKDNPIAAGKMLVYTADSELRGMGKTGLWIARQFHALPSSSEKSLTVFREIMMRASPHFTKLNKVLNRIPSARIPLWEGIFNRKPSAKTIAAKAHRDKLTEALLLQTPVAELSADIKKEVVAIREYLDGLYTWYTETMGMQLGRRKDYYPMMLDSQIIEKNRGNFIAILRKHGIDESKAQKIRAKITRDEDGGLNNGLQTEDVSSEFLGPGFTSKKRRARDDLWTDSLRADLVAAGFYQKDIATTLIAYTEMMVRRAVWERRFHEPAARDPSGGPSKAQIDAYDKLGVNIHHPIAALQGRLAKALETGDINQWQFERISKDILPAYAGQLGLRTNSHIRKLSSMIVIYQNLRLLSLALFSSFVDVGTLMARGTAWGDHKPAMRLLIDRASLAEAKEMLEAIGAMRQGLTEHVLNDQALNTFMTGNAKRINDLFFRYNGMEGWTNLMRTMAMVSGREFMQRNAKKAQAGDKTAQRYLDELDIKVGEVLAWDGHSTSDIRINAALNRYIDESMIRPDASIRPVWMSDPGYGVFAHLKGFLYGFQETFLRRVGREARIHQNLLPLFVLGMLALPFAAVGYELRKKLTGSKTDLHGLDYFLEVVERSGMPGAFQLVVDMEQADQFGKPFLLGIGGPAVEQLHDFITRDMSTVLPKAVPIVAQSPVLRDWVRDQFE